MSLSSDRARVVDKLRSSASPRLILSPGRSHRAAHRASLGLALQITAAVVLALLISSTHALASQVGIDMATSTRWYFGGADTQTVDITIGDHASRILIVMMAAVGKGDEVTCQFNGKPLAELQRRLDGDYANILAFGLENPDSGTHTLSCTSVPHGDNLQTTLVDIVSLYDAVILQSASTAVSSTGYEFSFTIEPLASNSVILDLIGGQRASTGCFAVKTSPPSLPGQTILPQGCYTDWANPTTAPTSGASYYFNTDRSPKTFYWTISPPENVYVYPHIFVEVEYRASGPIVADINPIAGTAGTEVSIEGENFGGSQGNGQVFFGSVSAKVVSWSDNLVRVIAPKGLTGAVTVMVGTDQGFSSGDATFSYGKPQPPKKNPRSPVIFIHGLRGSADSWAAMSRFVQQGGWMLGGLPTVHGTVDGVALQAGDFYMMQFSDNQQLSIPEQGAELSLVVNAVLAANGGATDVILVGHSMGGLAARWYLQFLGGGDLVRGLITVGTPHAGADLAAFCLATAALGALKLNLCDWVGIDPTSVAVNELRPNTPAAPNPILELLNQLRAAPLPDGIVYTSIIGKGKPTLVSVRGPSGDVFVSASGDGIVTEESQNLQSVIKAAGQPRIRLQTHAKALNIQACWPPILNVQTHTCETLDPQVWTQILHAINVTR